MAVNKISAGYRPKGSKSRIDPVVTDHPIPTIPKAIIARPDVRSTVFRLDRSDRYPTAGLPITDVMFHIAATTPSSGAVNPNAESSKGKMDRGTIAAPSFTKWVKDVRKSARR